jgi:Spy/CpxP family protein refolding chaperone
MNNIQLYLTIGIPTITVILAWLSNKSDMNSLRAEMRADNSTLRSEMKADIGALRSEMKADIGALRSEMKAEINALRAEMLNLRKEIYEALIPLHERMAVIEIKQK